jgi:signal recognition particle receptor subunit beta
VATEPNKSKIQYKILIGGAAVPAALQAIRDPDTAEAKSRLSGQDSKTQILNLDFASLDISSHERILLYSVPEQAQFHVVRDMLQKGALGLVLLIDNGSKNPFDDLDVYLKLLEGFIENTGVVIGINRSETYPSPTIHDYHSHLAKIRRNWKAPPPIMEVAPENRQEVKKLLLSLLFHLNPSL